MTIKIKNVLLEDRLPEISQIVKKQYASITFCVEELTGIVVF